MTDKIMIDGEPKSPVVSFPDGTKKSVKNLGYLRKNWKQVKRFEVINSGHYPHCVLSAFFADRRVFKTLFADKHLCWDWLHRPIFFGLKINFNGHKKTIVKGGKFQPEYENIKRK